MNLPAIDPFAAVGSQDGAPLARACPEINTRPAGEARGRPGDVWSKHNKGDEILVSSLLKALTESAGEFRFDDGREIELKGFTGPRRVHTLEWR